MIQVHHLTKTYEDPDGGEVAAVSGAVLHCKAGEIYGLLGPNGAGKTTTLRCLATILTPTAGSATIAGHDLIKDPQGVRRSIGFLSATTGLYARLTPRETLRFFGSLYGMSGDALEARVEQVIALFDIGSYADRPNDRLSTGMKQRAGLARAIVHDPPVLILDEPTSGLDPIVSRTVEEAVKSLAAAGKCVLFSTHLLAQAEDICSRIGVIGNGRVLAEGSIPELCALTGTQNLRQAFFKLVDSAPIATTVEGTHAFSATNERSFGVPQDDIGRDSTVAQDLSPARHPERSEGSPADSLSDQGSFGVPQDDMPGGTKGAQPQRGPFAGGSDDAA